MNTSISLASCREYAPKFLECVEVIASRLSLPSRQLAVRTLLHIPRIARLKEKLICAHSERVARALTREAYGNRRWESLAADPSLNFEMSTVALLDSLVFIQPLRHGSIKGPKHQDHTVQRET